MKYAVCIAPGCYGGPCTTILSVHRTARTAARAAMRSDRTCVVPFEDDASWARKGYQFTLRRQDITFMLPPQGSADGRYGRYGRGLA